MTHQGRTRRWTRLAIASLATLVAGVVGVGLLGMMPGRAAAPNPGQLPLSTVRRANLRVGLTAPGRIDSAEKTLIECEVEQIHAANAEGRGIRTSGFTTLLKVVPDGTRVRKGDIIALLDSSEFDEIVRQQRMTLERARAQQREAQLDLETAQVALKEYVDGLRLQQYKAFDGQIVLAQTELNRSEDRVEWAERMRNLGYISIGQYEQEKASLLRARLTLDRATVASNNYRKYTEPKIVRAYEAQVRNQEAWLQYQNRRVTAEQVALEKYLKQIENCTIRAPHDGMLIHANDDDNDPRIEVGIQVRWKMDLFYLPDLKNMQAVATLNETMVDRVDSGMTVDIRVDALPGRTFKGLVKSVDTMPQTTGNSWRSPQVKNFLGRIEILDADGLLPGMNALVDIEESDLGERLVIPSEALSIEGGRDVCYVSGPEGVERRPVTVAPGDTDVLEVVSGLSEGETVVLNPGRYTDVLASAPTRPGGSLAGAGGNGSNMPAVTLVP